ncbi:hypothetical protein A2733_00280 [Candidatus Nomurabacteria bacterium RIFCSPHIGHO2_01_FULL_40_20]|uniref:Uncharacterized protein n=1 Tax=Candidatus Nomurabacteria bacterium RIFCSPHIGHO2_01_FULL_40_20 TaxID=1801738 RepID=A0A1F6V1Z3_9BACT|nr:MAG: hypothetical protein A2733_00280 [Candidatus Nomurabacteria bacterium RIFCSPHIGHO2_01_FULL_40_20]
MKKTENDILLEYEENVGLLIKNHEEYLKALGLTQKDMERKIVGRSKKSRRFIFNKPLKNWHFTGIIHVSVGDIDFFLFAKYLPHINDANHAGRDYYLIAAASNGFNPVGTRVLEEGENYVGVLNGKMHGILLKQLESIRQ